MLCTILQGGEAKEIGKNADWEGRRSIEIIGYHHEQNKVNISFIFYLFNKRKNGVPNYLYVLHPVGVKFKLTKPWPTPCHDDEPDRKPNILDSVYRNAFTEVEGNLSQTQGLSSWDSWYGYIEKSITIWPNQEANFKALNDYIIQHYPFYETNDERPFTVMKLGPFTTHGPNLISLNIYMKDKAYEKTIDNNSVFTVDGPESLLLRIGRDYISQLSPQKKEWYSKLDSFSNYIGFGESYDVILIKSPYASPTETVWKDGIVKAPIQPSEEIATRYITRNNSFCLGLKYSSELIVKDPQKEEGIESGSEHMSM